MVLPILKNVEATIVGTIISMEKGLKIPPVKKSNILNCKTSYIKKEVEYKSLRRVALILNCRNILVKNPNKIMR